jgi:hypothetical protein
MGLVGFAFGLIMAHLPAPHDRNAFWISNLAAPWVVLPFIAGVVAPRRVPALALLVGCIACVASIIGFYWQVVLHGVVTSIAPWVVLAVVTGSLYGYFGRTWRQRGSRAAAIALTAPAILEFILWTARDRGVPRPYSLWLVETAVGTIGLIGMLYLARPRSDAAENGDCDGTQANPSAEPARVGDIQA